MSLARPIVVQVIVIITLGTLIGVADAFVLRPVRLGMEKPPEVDFGPKGSKTGAESPKPSTTDANSSKQPEKQPEHQVNTQPDPTPKTSATAAAPVAAPAGDFKPTPKDQLPQGQITLEEAKQAFDNQSATFIDSRKMESYEAAHIPGAFKIELHDFSTRDPQVLMLVPRDSNIIVYCNGGNCDESVKVAEMLNNSGYKKVYVLHDGLPGWKAMGWPTETGKGMMP